MANEKKFLDLVGLTRYDGKIKAYVDTAASNAAGTVDTNIRKDYKVKDVDLTNNGKVALTLDDNGKVAVTVDANVVKDAEYATVKSNANNSAAAWNKFLVGSEGVAPTLVQLATKDDAQGYATTAQSAAIAKAGELDAALESKITTAYGQADATVKSELIGNASDASSVDTIKGAKKYADDLANGLSTRIDDLVAGGVTFKGVVDALPSLANDGDLIIMGADVTVGDVTYKKDYEYIYSNGTWYELGDSDKNAKAITAVESKVNSNTNAISALDTAYKAADSELESKINAVSNTLIGDNTNSSDADTIWGAKNYAAGLVQTLGNSFVAITDEEINGLFAA